MTWLEAIGQKWDQQTDEPRFRAAFTTLAATCDHWPAPKLFLAALPDQPREYFRALGTDAGTGKREVPPATRAIIDGLAKHLGVKDGD